jgi:hypothetical protein
MITTFGSICFRGHFATEISQRRGEITGVRGGGGWTRVESNGGGGESGIYLAKCFMGPPTTYGNAIDNHDRGYTLRHRPVSLVIGGMALKIC